MSKENPALTRRQFLGQASCAAVGSTALLSTLLSLRLANSLAAQTTSPSPDYRALVCLFLAGGNDSFNMLAPLSDGEYQAYAQARGNLALPRADFHPLVPDNLGGRSFGLHRAMPGLRDLFNAGNLAFVSNVGSLIRPLTLAQYQAGQNLPLSLYSHSDQIKQWQTCMPDSRTAVGWGGRAADILRSLNNPSQVSMNISLAGESTFLTGRDVFNYTVTPTGATPLRGFVRNPVTALDAIRTTAINNQLDAQYANLLEQSYVNSTRRAINAYDEFTDATNAVTIPPPATSTTLANSLGMVARTIGARAALGTRRQVFFVMLGGWDHHDEVLNNQNSMLGVVNDAVQHFWNALGTLGVRQNVTLFSASDFGRTLSSNGNGSDHAWGGNHFVLGGAVRGRRIVGNPDQGHYPDLRNLAQIDTGQGRLIPGVAVDEYARDLMSWFGVSATDMDYVLPAFSSRFAGRAPLGIFG